MKLWIRIDTAIRSDPNVAELANRLGISVAEAVGLCTLTWAAIAEHRPTGNLLGISSSALDEWAGFKKKQRRPAGEFGAAFRDLFVTGDTVRGWKDRQGKLLERAEKDRARKLHGSSTEVVGNSTPTVRNGTELQSTSAESGDVPASPLDSPRPSKPKRGGLVPTPDEAELFAHYRVKHPRRGPPDDDQIRKVRRGFVSFNLEQMKQAVDGNLEDEWCVKTGKHEIGWIFRNNDHISRAIESYHRAHAPLFDDDGKLTADGQRVFGSAA